MFPKPHSTVLFRDCVSWQTNIWYIAALQKEPRFLFASTAHGPDTAS